MISQVVIFSGIGAFVFVVVEASEAPSSPCATLIPPPQLMGLPCGTSPSAVIQTRTTSARDTTEPGSTHTTTPYRMTTKTTTPYPASTLTTTPYKMKTHTTTKIPTSTRTSTPAATHTTTPTAKHAKATTNPCAPLHKPAPRREASAVYVTTTISQVTTELNLTGVPPERTCAGFKCPVGMLLRDLAQKIVCHDCSYTAVFTCCSPVDHDRHMPSAIHEDHKAALSPVFVAYCSNLTCPKGMVYKSTPEKRRCQAVFCDYNDIVTCCRPPSDTTVRRSSCAGCKCPKGHLLTLRPETVMCHAEVCDDSDIGTCCVAVVPALGLASVPTSQAQSSTSAERPTFLERSNRFGNGVRRKAAYGLHLSVWIATSISCGFFATGLANLARGRRGKVARQMRPVASRPDDASYETDAEDEPLLRVAA